MGPTESMPIPPADATAVIAPPAVGTTVYPTPGPSEMNFGKYRILGEIGRGGMGIVYRAWECDLGRTVALKMILASHLSSQQDLHRFQAEARAAAGLRHPNIVQVHEVGQIAGQHVFVMDYVEGSNLAQRKAEYQLPAIDPKTRKDAAGKVWSKAEIRERASKLVFLLAQVSRAVEYLHAQRIVHRDLKPSNILLNAVGSPFLTDFGLVKILGGADEATMTGCILGTLAYMPPEQAAGRREVNPASDVYSLGVILYEFLTGRPPFSSEVALDTLVQVLESEPVPPSRLNGQVPHDLELICLRCLEKEPGRRYPSAGALAEDLDRFLAGEEVEVKPTGLRRRLWRWARREPALAAHLSGLSVFAAIVQVSYLIARPVSFPLYVLVMSCLAACALASLVCQRMIRVDALAKHVPYAWMLADMAFMWVILAISGNQASQLVVIFPVMIGISCLWSIVRLVWFTTLLAEAAYLSLIVQAHLTGIALDWPHHHLMFMVGLAVMGFVMSFQVRRIHLLREYHDRRSMN